MWKIKKLHSTVVIPMVGVAAMTVAFVLAGIGLLDAKAIIIQQDAAIRFHIVNNTALMLDYVKLEKACGDIVMRSKLHEH